MGDGWWVHWGTVNVDLHPPPPYTHTDTERQGRYVSHIHISSLHWPKWGAGHAQRESQKCCFGRLRARVTVCHVHNRARARIHVCPRACVCRWITATTHHPNHQGKHIHSFISPFPPSVPHRPPSRRVLALWWWWWDKEELIYRKEWECVSVKSSFKDFRFLCMSYAFPKFPQLQNVQPNCAHTLPTRHTWPLYGPDAAWLQRVGSNVENGL